MRILVTGGAGYIGSHTCVELLEAGHELVIVDNLSNSERDVIDRIAILTGKQPIFYPYDLLNRSDLEQVFMRHSLDAVFHFAGLKAVGESVALPLVYYQTNLQQMFHVCEMMQKYHVNKLIFSSSATVYGSFAGVPISEEAEVVPTSPYGRTKWMQEQLLQDMASANPDWRVAVLRYFNPIGAHISGMLGEKPEGIPNNLLPYVAQVASGQLQRLFIFGDDYETPDGTGIRDYIHVSDLAYGHVLALQQLEYSSGVHVYNLGTGRGYSVLEVVEAFERASGITIPYQFAPRRSGDAGICYAAVEKANTLLGFRAARTIDEMCLDAWRWQENVSRKDAGILEIRHALSNTAAGYYS